MTHSLPISPEDYFGPPIGALVFIGLMSLVKEPARRNLNAIVVGGAMGAYISGGLGFWELPFAVLGIVVAYHGLRSHPLIGVAWLMHSTWDIVHHFFGNPIWPFMRTSSFGCCIFDAVLAVWFLAGAPSVFASVRARGASLRRRGGAAAMSTATAVTDRSPSRTAEDDIATSLTLPVVGVCVAAVVAVSLWALLRAP